MLKRVEREDIWHSSEKVASTCNCMGISANVFVPAPISIIDEKKWITERQIRLGSVLVNQAVVSILLNCLVEHWTFLNKFVRYLFMCELAHLFCII